MKKIQNNTSAEFCLPKETFPCEYVVFFCVLLIVLFSFYVKIGNKMAYMTYYMAICAWIQRYSWLKIGGFYLILNHYFIADLLVCSCNIYIVGDVHGRCSKNSQTSQVTATRDICTRLPHLHVNTIFIFILGHCQWNMYKASTLTCKYHIHLYTRSLSVKYVQGFHTYM